MLPSSRSKLHCLECLPKTGGTARVSLFRLSTKPTTLWKQCLGTHQWQLSQVRMFTALISWLMLRSSSMRELKLFFSKMLLHVGLRTPSCQKIRKLLTSLKQTSVKTFSGNSLNKRKNFPKSCNKLTLTVKSPQRSNLRNSKTKSTEWSTIKI